MTEEIMKKIEDGVKELGKKSTAPDKETPDWMESDIRRGAYFGYQLAQHEIERLKGLLKKEIFESVDVCYTDRKDEFDIEKIKENCWKQYCEENNL